MTHSTDLDEILEIGTGFWKSKVLLSAVGLDLFTSLDGQGATLDELVAAMNLHPRGARDFLDVLVATRLLDREGSGAEAVYRAAPRAVKYLSKKSPSYIGGIVDMWNTRSYKIWGNLDAALKTGQAQSEMKMFKLQSMPTRLQAFSKSMEQISRRNFEELVKVFDLSDRKTICDIGGASGLLCTTLAQAAPHLRCITFDLAPVEPIARAHVQDEGLADRVDVVAGDFCVDPLPRADMYTMSMVLHGLDLAQKQHLLKLAYDALPANGVLVAIENLVDDERRENAVGLLMSLNMLLELGGAAEFSFAEFTQWCGDAGFCDFVQLPLTSRYSAAIAFKADNAGAAYRERASNRVAEPALA